MYGFPDREDLDGVKPVDLREKNMCSGEPMLKRRLSKLRLKSAVLHIGALLILFVALSYAPSIQRLDMSFNDRALQNSVKIGSPDIVVLEIDDRTKDDAGNFPLSREYVADVIENIAKIRPQKILFDGILAAEGQPDHDKRLALAIENLGPEKIAIGGLNKSETKPELLPNAQFSAASTVFGAALYTDSDGMHRTVTTGMGEGQTLVNPSRWLAGEISMEPVIIDQGIDPDSYLRLPISEFKGQADLNLIDKTFIIGEAADLAHSKVYYPTEMPISRAAFLAVGADTVMQGTELFNLSFTILAQILLAIGAAAAVMVFSLKKKLHLLFGAIGGSVIIVVASLVGLNFFDALMHVTLLLSVWNSTVLVTIAYKKRVAETVYDFWKGDLSADESKTWRELGHATEPLILLSAQGAKRINDNAHALGITSKDYDTIEAIRAIAVGLSYGETKTAAFNLMGKKQVFSISKPYANQSLVQLENVTKADEAPDRFATVFEVDQLTKCQNKAGFTKNLHALVKLKEPVAIFKIELAGFSFIRELHGKEAADALLVKAVDCFKGNLREGDNIARLQEDEFAIMIKGTQTESYLKAMRNTFEKALGSNVRINGHVMAIGVCAGFTQTNGSESHMEINKAVDQSLSARKEQFKSGGRAIAQIGRKAA